MDRFGRAGGTVPGHAPGFMEAYRDMESYFVGKVQEHLAHDPKYCQKEERISPLIRALTASIKADPGAMTDFLRSFFPPALAGGLSTAAHIYVNSIDVMLDHPDVWQQVRADRSLIDPDGPSEVVEEILRLKSVHAGLHRFTTRDVEVRGTLIPKGSMVQLFYISSDHDEEAFEDPEEFKLRGLSRHLAFGFGTHTCIGQSYGRATLKILVNKLMDKFTVLERAAERQPWPFRGGYYTPDKLMVVGRTSGSAPAPAVCPFSGSRQPQAVGHTSGQLMF
jgi:cytochrome P450